MKYDYNVISKRIRDKRTELGMTQEELALKCGYKGRSSINKIELDSRNVQIERLVMIADALGCSPDYLIGWDAESVPLGVDIEIEKAKQQIDSFPRDKTEEAIIQIYRTLSQEDKETVAKLVSRLASPKKS